MQLRKEHYDSREHLKFKALSINQPYAKFIADGEKTLEVRTRNLKYRGDVVICSTKKPTVVLRAQDSEDYVYGAILCIVELYDVVKFKDLTDVEKAQTKIPENQWRQHNGHYVWKLRNVRRLIEKPVIGGQGLFNLYCRPDYIMEYPLELGERKLTPSEQIRAFGEEAENIKLRAKKGLFVIGVGFTVGILIIYAIARLITYFIDKC